MDEAEHDLALELDLERSGFTGAERRAFYVAIGKPLDSLTCAEWGLLARYERARYGELVWLST
jgi:hypothetical protein